MALHLNAWLFKCETQTVTPCVCLFPLTNKGNFLQGYLVTLHISVGNPKHHTHSVFPFLSFQVCSSEGYAAFLMTLISLARFISDGLIHFSFLSLTIHIPTLSPIFFPCPLCFFHPHQTRKQLSYHFMIQRNESNFATAFEKWMNVI